MARSTHTKSFSSFSIESLLRDDSGHKTSCGSSSACSQSTGFSDLLHLHTARTELVSSPSTPASLPSTPRALTLSPTRSPTDSLDSCSERSFFSSHSDATEDDDLEPTAKRQKKARTSFTSHQINSLEGAYRARRYIPAGERKQLAKRLHLSDQQVKTWFQNRRMKEKRMVPMMPHPLTGLAMPSYSDIPVTSYPSAHVLPSHHSMSPFQPTPSGFMTPLHVSTPPLNFNSRPSFLSHEARFLSEPLLRISPPAVDSLRYYPGAAPPSVFSPTIIGGVKRDRTEDHSTSL